MYPTQDHLPIEDIHDDVVILKDGSMAIVIQTSAVNFGLLSENEQLAIISAFAGLLNSLSFVIQILIRSKRLDISAYLKLLDESIKTQPNPQLALLMGKYRNFIDSTIRENEVLDKQFYIVIPVSYLELGLVKNVAGNFQKAMTILLPRRDHVIRQLARIGLKSTQLNTKELIMLFYDIYNEQNFLPEQSEELGAVDQKKNVSGASSETGPVIVQPSVNPPVIGTLTPQHLTSINTNVNLQSSPTKQSQPAAAPPVSNTESGQQPGITGGNTRRVSGGMPFVVEELPEDYGRAR